MRSSIITHNQLANMSSRAATMLISLLLATAISALAMPPALNTTNLSSISLPQALNTPQYGCTKVGFLRTDLRPTWSDCFRAIRLMPVIHNSGTFHTSGYNDVWRLPRTETFVKCRAQVETGNRMRTPSSWVAVNAALDQLNSLCRVAKPSKKERSGGWMFLDADKKIKVSLLGEKDPESIGPPITGIPSLFIDGTSNGTLYD